METPHTLTLPLRAGTDRSLRVDFAPGRGDELAVILPGLRYGCERPLLRAVASVFEARGCDLARVRFAYTDDAPFLGADDATQLAWIASDGRDILSRLLADDRHARVWVIGKSLGTIAMGGGLPKSCAADLRPIWLTPSLRGTGLQAQVLSRPEPALLVIGTEDPSCIPEQMAPLDAARGITVVRVDGADHGFERRGGPEASRAAVAEAVAAVRDWIAVVEGFGPKR